MSAEMVRRAAGVLFEPGQVVEVRALAQSGRPRSGYFDDFDLLAEKVDALGADPSITGIYWTLNPCLPDLVARRTNAIGPARETTTDAGILARRWLLVDADPVRASGISATDGEKAAALARAGAIAAALEADGWPAPVRADSGNGAHLLYRIDLENNADATALVRQCLQALAARFSDDAVTVDVSVANPARIVRAYGTPNRKGANRPDRPHRATGLTDVPDSVTVVPVALLEALANERVPAVPAVTAVTPVPHSPAAVDLRAWIERHAPRLAAAGYRLVEKPKSGHQYFAEIEPCPWSSDHATGAYLGQANHGGVYARCQHASCGGAGGPNRWPEFRREIEPPPEPGHDDGPRRLTLSYFEKDGDLYLVAITQDDGFGFLHLEPGGAVGFAPSVTLGDGTIVEPRRLGIHQDSGELIRVVGIPRLELVRAAPVPEARALFRRIDEHIDRYADLPVLEREMGAYYALFSWFYTRRATSPYLRYIGDTGTGKSRCARVIVDLCFLPLLLSGGTSPSALMRQHEKWRGTVLLEEADFAGDMASPVIKWLNVGFERGTWTMLSDKNDPSTQQAFRPWGPKVIAMRTPFRDNATEARCLSYSPRETRRNDIPRELPPAYHEAVTDLRATIARFVLAHWQDFDPQWMVAVPEVEARIQQMAEPVSAILQYVDDGVERYRAYVRARQREVRRTRSESREGAFFNEALTLALGEADGGPVEAVTARMVADAFRTSPMGVTVALKSIGFEVERERIAVRSDEGVWKRTVRRLAVPSAEAWDQIVRRYYFESEDAPAPDCPEALRGSAFRSRPAAAADPFARWDQGGGCADQASQLSQLSRDFARMPGPDRYVCVQAHPAPCDECGRSPSHYVASGRGAAMIEQGDPANHHLCRRCWLALAEPDAVPADGAAG